MPDRFTTEQAYWDDDAERLNKMAELALSKGYAVKHTAAPPALKEDGSLADDTEEEPAANFNPDQPRAADGKFGSGGASASTGKVSSGKGADKKLSTDELKQKVAELKGDKSMVVLKTEKGTEHKIRNHEDLREFLADGGKLPAATDPSKKVDGKTEDGQSAEAKTEMPKSEKKGVFEKLTTAYTNTKDAALALGKRMGKPVWDKLPESAQNALSKTYGMAMVVEHHLEGLHTAGQNIAKAIVAEKGLSQSATDAIGKALNVADTAMRWGPNIPVLHSALHSLAHLGGPVSFGAAKLAYYVPVASLAFVASAPLHSPLATIRAARKGIQALRTRKSSPALAAHMAGYVWNSNDEDHVLIAQAISEHEDDVWFQALLYAAIDETMNVKQAVELADEHYAAYPEGPPEGTWEDEANFNGEDIDAQETDGTDAGSTADQSISENAAEDGEEGEGVEEEQTADEEEQVAETGQRDSRLAPNQAAQIQKTVGKVAALRKVVTEETKVIRGEDGKVDTFRKTITTEE